MPMPPLNASQAASGTPTTQYLQQAKQQDDEQGTVALLSRHGVCWWCVKAWGVLVVCQGMGCVGGVSRHGVCWWCVKAWGVLVVCQCNGSSQKCLHIRCDPGT
jgi:hypothetical protein